MNIDVELKNHLLCETLINNIIPPTLLEARGVINGIDTVVDVFMKTFIQQIHDTFTEGEVIKTYDNPDILKGISTFFTNFQILLRTHKSEKSSYHGGTYPSSVKFDNTTNRWYCEPYITLTINASTEKKLFSIIKTILAHELTHCYNMFLYSKQNNKDVFNNIEKQQRYYYIKRASDSNSNNERAIANILYLLNRMERNANIAQLREELLDNKEKMTDDKSIFDLIKSSDSYRKLKTLEKNINLINTLTNEYTQKQLIKYVNQIMGKNYTNYNQVKKYLNNRWNKWKNAYLCKACKVAYDVFLTTGRSTCLDWGLHTNDLPTLKETPDEE